MDPRGLGESTPIGDVLRDRFATTKLPLTDDEYEDIVDFNRDMAQKSLDMNGDIIKHVDTVSIARDMEAVRLALGEPQLTFFGFSYGTQLGATYAELFPTRFRAMVFDGVHDHTAGSLEMALRYHSAHQDAFDRFAAWCDSSFACVLHGHDLHRSLDRALEIVGDGAVCLSDWITLMLVEGWFTGAADALASVLGKSSFIGFLIGLFVTLATEPPGRPNWSFMPMTADTMCQMFPESIPADYIAIHCGDGPSTSPNVSELNALQHSIEAVAPSMRKGGAFKDRVSSCLGWPFPPKNPPHRLQLPLDIPPILIVNSLYDYRTPYASAVNIQSQVPGSVLLTTRSEGHCSYNKWGSEASGIIEEYLINGTLPAPGTIVDS